MLREGFFQDRPNEKAVFESAMLRPPRHLAGQIQELRAPIRRLNREFIERMVARMPLRQDLEPEKVSRYLAGIEPFFQDILNSLHETQDLHAMLNASGELLNMVLFGVLRQDGGAEERPPQT